MVELNELISCLENRVENLKELQKITENNNKIKAFSDQIITELNVIEKYCNSVKKRLKKIK